MRIHSNRFAFNGISEINIQGIDCTYENVNAVLKAFNFNQTLITVDSIENNSNFFLLLESLNLKFTFSVIDANTREISTIVPFKLLEDVIAGAIQNDPENIFITNIKKLIDIRILSATSPICTIKNGFSDVIVVIARDKHVIHFTFDSKEYSNKEVSNRIKNILCNRV